MMFTAEVNGRQLEWSVRELRTLLQGVASCEKRKRWLRWDLTVASSSAFDRFLWVAARHFAILREHFYGVDVSVSREILQQLHPQTLRANDSDLVVLFQRAVRNFNTIAPAHQTVPVETYEKHYRAPDFRIPHVDLTLDVRHNHVMVTTRLKVSRNTPASTLVLDGSQQDVQAVWVDGRRLSRDGYQVTDNELIVPDIPKTAHFEIIIRSKVYPYGSDLRIGLLHANDCLVTRCALEGARRIFFTLDRPDVLSQITTTLIADKKRYPHQVANGDLVYEGLADDDRGVFTWEDPIPKPSYLFGVALGKFGVVDDTFVTRSGREVSLRIFTARGKEGRAQYAMWALKKAMAFDEAFFDREYDLDSLRVVAVADYDAAVTVNKGLLIFDETALLADPATDTDAQFQRVTKMMMHGYAHNWTGNRVGIRSWFEVPVQEALADMRASEYLSWLFGEELCRVTEVAGLRQHHFPQDTGFISHPLQVKSYVQPDSLFDSTTSFKGREVLRTLKALVDGKEKGLFRRALNKYFATFDQQAVTYRELLWAMREESGLDLSVYERWFWQQGIPRVNVFMDYDAAARRATIHVHQSCLSPLTGKGQEPFHIPLRIELLADDGKVVMPIQQRDVTEREACFVYEDIAERPIPVFMHGFSAPVNVHYDYSDDELATIVMHDADAYCRWEAMQQYAARQLLKVMKQVKDDPDGAIIVSSDVVEMYRGLLSSNKLSPVAKALLVETPSLSRLCQEWNHYDFALIAKVRAAFRRSLAERLEEDLVGTIESHAAARDWEITGGTFVDEIHLRSLRGVCSRYLVELEKEQYLSMEVSLYEKRRSFHDTVEALKVLGDSSDPRRWGIADDFYWRWKDDKGIFNHWIIAQAGSKYCTVNTLKRIENVEGYDRRNSNHLRSALLTFVNNLVQYHDGQGAGYRYITDRILDIDRFNSHLAVDLLAREAYKDYGKLPSALKELMGEQLERIKVTRGVSENLRMLVTNFLKS